MRANRSIVRRGTALCRALFFLVLLMMASRVSGEDAGPGERTEWLWRLAHTGRDGSQSRVARQTWQRLVESDAAALPEILAAMKDADPMGVNWLRTAYDAILRRERAAATAIPWDQLVAVIVDPQYDARARRLAWSTVDNHRPDDAQQLLTALLDDPEFRLQAVQMLIEDAEAAVESGDLPFARQLYRRAFEASVDYDQINRLSGRLASLDDPVELRTKLGVPERWQVLGPFPGYKMSGFQRTYPPEERVDLDGTYSGSAGPIGWRSVAPGEDGQVDLNEVFGVSSDTVAYAYTELHAPQRMDAQLLAGADDNLAVWFNGQKVFAFPHYHQHLRVDRFRIPVRLAEGKNTLLLKVCQSVTPPDYPRPNQWQFIFRIVDPDGRPLPVDWTCPESRLGFEGSGPE